jgi:hypothetical protein
MTTKVDDASPEVMAQRAHHPMLEALLGGTPAMRAGKTRYLPKWPREDDDAYDKRVGTATLFPAYRRTVSVMVGKPFSKELTFSKDTPVEIQGVEADENEPNVTPKPGWADDIDLQGTCLHVFAAETFEESFYGLCFLLAEAPPATATGTANPSVADQERANIRPYLVRIDHSQFLGWKIALVNGRRVITQFRYMETVEEDDGPFGTVSVDQVRVLEPGKWTTYRRVGGQPTAEFVPHQTGPVLLGGGKPAPYVPVVPVYGRRKGFLTGQAPLLDLAFLNVEHWQSKSDQQNILHVARVPILFGAGFGDTEDIVIGAGIAVKSGDANAKLEYVEHKGGAINAGRQSLKDLEDEMIQAGAELIVNRPGTRTATEDANDEEGNKSDLQRMVEGFQDSLNLALSYLADLGGLAASGSVSIFQDFGIASLELASAQLIKDLMVAGKLSTETGLAELQRRGQLDADLDVAAEVERVQSEGPALGMIPGAKASGGGPLPIGNPEGQAASL